MKKRVLAIALFFVMLFSITVTAAENASYTPHLSFEGNTAICTATIIAAGEEIDVRLTLWHGDDMVYYWTQNDTDVVSIRGQVRVTYGEEYTLTLTGTIGGEDIGEISVDGTC